MYERSGSRCRPSGAGTQTRTASHSARSAKSRRADPAAPEGRGDALGPDVPDVGGTRVQGARRRGIDVEADDGKPGLLEEERERKTRRNVFPRSRNPNAILGLFDTPAGNVTRSEEHTSELQSLRHLVCRLL